MAEATVTINTNGRLHRLALLAGGQSPAMGEIFEAWSKIYGGFVRKRFVKASRGDGTWPPLKPSTIRRRRKGKGTGQVAILRDTGLMFSEFVPRFIGSSQGNPSGRATFTATVSFGGESAYPDGVLVSDVMGFHHRGDGVLPQRKLLVAPDSATKEKMAAVGKRISARYVQDGS